MSLSQISFWFFILWIVGCALFSVGISYVYIVLCVALLGAIFLNISIYTNRRIWIWRAGLCLCILFGAGYAAWFSTLQIQPQRLISFGVSKTYTGIVIASPTMTETTQIVQIRTDEGTIQVRIPSAYTIAYHDHLVVTGVIEHANATTTHNFQNTVLGIMSFARVDTIIPSKTFSIYRLLYTIRNTFSEHIQRVFPRDEADLATGLLLGKQSVRFSSSLHYDMKQSGTTHLVALSGYNIAIVIQMLYGVFSFFVSRKKSFWLLIFGVISFVCMTGAEASVVRAAIMGSGVLFAQKLSRVYNFSHAMAITAWVMILLNPLSFLVDIGFILSFISLWGLAYISPILHAWISKIPHIPSWLSLLCAQTIGAQCAVAPALLFWFGGVSLSGIVTNIILLPLVPYVMGLSFSVAMIHIIIAPLGWFFGQIISPLLSFFIHAIHLGAQFGFTQYNISWWVMFFVYILMIWFGVRYKNMHSHDYTKTFTS